MEVLAQVEGDHVVDEVLALRDRPVEVFGKEVQEVVRGPGGPTDPVGVKTAGRHDWSSIQQMISGSGASSGSWTSLR